MRRGLAGVLAVMAAAVMLIGAADDPADRLKNPAEEARARALFQQLRCVVCQNESIDDSEADLAQDLRRIVRGQIAQGRSDDQVRAFLVQRYGQFILLKPPLSPGNAALWLTPLVLVLAGGAYVWRRSRAVRPDDLALTAAEERALSRLQTGDGVEVAPRPEG
jgi:cytochrome c-type biogenesis protein CcmH